MKARIKAWQNIYDGTNLIIEEVGLKALDGILYGPVWEIKGLTTVLAEQMADEFRKLHPDFQYDHLEIQSKEG